MKKLFLIVCLLGSFAFMACGDKTKDCACNIKQSIPDLNINGGMKYTMHNWKGECSEINVETLGLSMDVEGHPVQFEVSCQEK